jgi:hypothetical protein
MNDPVMQDNGFLPIPGRGKLQEKHVRFKHRSAGRISVSAVYSSWSGSVWMDRTGKLAVAPTVWIFREKEKYYIPGQLM